jgi:hypothetical protein
MDIVALSRRSVLGATGAMLAYPNAALAQATQRPEDPRLGRHPEAYSAIELLHSRQWRELARLVERQTPDSACVLLNYVGDHSNVDIDISQLANERMGPLIAGALLVNWGWRYRGTGVASTVTEQMADAFGTRLLEAKTQLDSAIASGNGAGSAHAFLFQTLKGLSPRASLRSVAVARRRIRVTRSARRHLWQSE